MARLNKETHEELHHGVGKCSVPMWSGHGVPAGFCNENAYGPRPPTTYIRDGWTGRRVRTDGRYDGYVPTLACPRHGGPDAPNPDLVGVERATWKGRPVDPGSGDGEPAEEDR